MTLPDRRSSHRACFALAALLLGLYALNIGLGMAAVKLGLATWRVGDVGEFLLVLFAMAAFVAGLLADEGREEGKRSDGSQTNQGGEP